MFINLKTLMVIVHVNPHTHKKYNFITKEQKQHFICSTLRKVLDVHTHVVRDKGPTLVLTDRVVVRSRWFVIKDHIK